MDLLGLLYETLIAGDAYRYFLSGMGVTVLITLVGTLIGTAVGAILCVLSLSRFKAARFFYRIYSTIVGGTPTLLFLMLSYYAILAPFISSALTIAFLAFGLKIGVNAGEIIKSAIAGVDAGQIQAARTLGFSASGAFFNITFPQAAAFALPLYRNMILDLLQWTSVAGYITIADLTRVVNNMQARTGQPFFAMTMGVVLYLAIAGLIHFLFKGLAKQTGVLI